MKEIINKNDFTPISEEKSYLNKYNGFDFDSKTPIKKLTVKQLSFFIVSVAFFAYFAFNVGKDIGLTIYNLLH